jgi:hypothetical protein
MFDAEIEITTTHFFQPMMVHKKSTEVVVGPQGWGVIDRITSYFAARDRHVVWCSCGAILLTLGEGFSVSLLR